MAYCTLYDKNYMHEARAACISLKNAKRRRRARQYAFCLDDESLEYTSQRCCVTAISLSQLEEKYPVLLTVKDSRDWPSYTQTCKVFLPSYLFEVWGQDFAIYFDSDVYFWSDPEFVEDELRGNSFLVTSREHIVRPPQGDYNGGFWGVNNTEDGRAFLAWWQQKCIERCEWKAGPNGEWTEEGYLNVFTDEPDRFRGVRHCKNPGVNLAKWNVDRHSLEQQDDQVILDGKWPLICFHYKGFDPDHEFFGLGQMPTGVLHRLCSAYKDALDAVKEV